MVRIKLIVAWSVLAVLSALLICKINFTSDTLFLDSVMVDMFQHGGKWHDWKITPAPAYFPDMVAYGVGYLVFPTPTQRMAFVSVVQALLLAWACIRLAVTIRPAFSVDAKLLVFVILSFVTLAAENSSMWLYFYSTNNHFAALLFPLLCMSFVLAFWAGDRRLDGVLLVLCVTLGTMSTPVFVISFTLPALLFASVSFFFLRAHRELKVLAAKTAGLIMLGQVLASGLNAVVLSFDAFGGRAPKTVPAAINSFEKFMAATQAAFGHDNRYTFALAVMGSVIMAWVILEFVLRARISLGRSSGHAEISLQFFSDNWRYNLCLIFLLIAFPLNVVGSIASGGFVDPWAYRYFAFPIALGWLAWVIAMDEKGVFARRKLGYVFILLLVLEAILGVVSAKRILADSGRSYADVSKSASLNTSIALGHCIDQEARNGFAFDGGVADFWNSRETLYATRAPSHILTITNDLNPLFHMMTIGPLVNPAKYGIKSYNFVIMRKSGTVSQFDLTPEITGKILPPPARIVKCDNTDSELWLYQDRALDNEVKKHIARFLLGIGQPAEYILKGAELPGEVGRVESGARVATQGSDKASFLSYGPYIRIAGGRYKVDISYSATQAGNRWDAGRFNNPGKLAKLASGDFPAGEGTVEFYIDTKRRVEDLEIRTWFGGQGTLTVHSIKIQSQVPAAAK